MVFWPGILTVIGFAAGIGLRHFFDLGWPLPVFLLTLSAVSFVASGRRLAALIFLAAALGFWRLDFSLGQEFWLLDTQVGQTITLEGVIADEPDDRENNTKLLLRIAGGVKVLFTINRHSGIAYGDRLKITGRLLRPENFTTNAGREFDYIGYLAKDRIFYQMFYPRVEKIASGQGNFIKEKLLLLKYSWLKNLEALLPEPQASLAAGLIVGARRGLGPELTDHYRRAGAIHVVVLSGYNITLIADYILKFFSFLPRYLNFGLASAAIVAFAVMVGAGATVVRASIMALAVILGRATGRPYNATYALFLAVFFMLLHNPKILLWDIGFHLSFLATLGLIHLGSRLESFLHLIPNRWQIRSVTASTLAAQLSVLPWLIYKIGQISFVALPVNILILPFIPLTMLFGFLTGLFGWISLIFAAPFSYVAWFLLSYQLWIVNFFASLPLAVVDLN